MNKIWGDLDHRLSVIIRWQTMHHLHRQSVAEHIFNVERIAIRIAKEWFGIQDKERLWAIANWAHHHEDFEALSNDFPSMVKPYFDEEAFTKEHSDVIEISRPLNEEVKNIVKLADMLDAWWFLCVEVALGNNYIYSHYKFEPTRILSYVEEKWPDDDGLYEKVRSQIDTMRNETSLRHSRRGK